MEDLERDKYERAKKKVSEIKGFYNHLIVYIIVNAFLLFIHMGLFNNGLFELRTPSWSSLGTPFFWGIGLAFHALKVFHHNFTFFKNWEDRKIKEIMDQEEEELKRTNKWK